MNLVYRTVAGELAPGRLSRCGPRRGPLAAPVVGRPSSQTASDVFITTEIHAAYAIGRDCRDPSAPPRH